MPIRFEEPYAAIGEWSRLHAIQLKEQDLPEGKAGEFDGPNVTMNVAYSLEERTYYLVHALGSIVGWSLAKDRVQSMFDELKAAKKTKDIDPGRLERAIIGYRAFETESSEYAVWLLSELKFPDVIPSYTNFMRADLDALTEFHRHGLAPVWRQFFAKWNEEVATNRRHVDPYQSKSIPPFTPVKIRLQEILQQQD